MNHLLDDDDAPLRRDRELTLSTGSILGIFFGLVLLCGLFFGLGYNLGSHKAPAIPTVASTAPVDAAPATDFSAFKPSAGSPSGLRTAAAANPSSSPSASNSPASALSAAAEARPAQHGAVTPLSLPSARSAESVAPGATSPATTAAGSFVVQVAAVSHQEDADLLLSALKNRGYHAFAHSTPQDALIHIQVGPFGNKADADTMRQKLLADGYNAIVK